MPFTIRNETDAEDETQAAVDKVDVDILVAGFAGTGVVSGCAVTAQGSPSMVLSVSSGEAAVLNVPFDVIGDDVTVDTADGTNPRFDLVVVDDTGTLAVVEGTPAPAPSPTEPGPVFPAIPADSVVLAAVRVPATDTTISTGQITDKRVMLTPQLTVASSGSVVPDLSVAGQISFDVFGTQGISAITSGASTIRNDVDVVFLTSTGAYAMTSTPTIADGYDGQRIRIINTSAFTISLLDNALLPGVNLVYGEDAIGIALGVSQSIDFTFSSTINNWVMTSYTGKPIFVNPTLTHGQVMARISIGA